VLWAALHGLDHFRKRDRIQPVELRVAALELELYRGLLLGWGADRTAVDDTIGFFTTQVADAGP
jgi:hypothetical protein